MLCVLTESRLRDNFYIFKFSTFAEIQTPFNAELIIIIFR